MRNGKNIIENKFHEKLMRKLSTKLGTETQQDKISAPKYDEPNIIVVFASEPEFLLVSDIADFGNGSDSAEAQSLCLFFRWRDYNFALFTLFIGQKSYDRKRTFSYNRTTDFRLLISNLKMNEKRCCKTDSISIFW